VTPLPDSLKNLGSVQEQFSGQLLALRGYLIALVRDTHLADDLLQETFLTACEKCDSFETGTNFKAWVFAIARFKALNAIRSRARSEHLLSTETLERVADHYEPPADQTQKLRLLEQCIGKLSPKAREVIRLRYQHAIGPEAISRHLGRNKNQINVLLFRARQALRDCVEQELPTS
jgi:RNA polymerase sigma-70 factor, ECF subfamily